MESKAYALIVLAVIAGLIGGYVVGSMSFQNQVIGLQLEISNYLKTITDKDIQINELQDVLSNNQKTILDLQLSISEFQYQITGLQARARLSGIRISLLANPFISLLWSIKYCP